MEHSYRRERLLWLVNAEHGFKEIISSKKLKKFTPDLVFAAEYLKCIKCDQLVSYYAKKDKTCLSYYYLTAANSRSYPINETLLADNAAKTTAIKGRKVIIPLLYRASDESGFSP